jgi:hypothetical protein
VSECVSRDYVGLNCDPGVMITVVPLSHNHVGVSCGPRGLVLCSLVGSFLYLQGRWQMNAAGSSELLVTTCWSVQHDS